MARWGRAMVCLAATTIPSGCYPTATVPVNPAPRRGGSGVLPPESSPRGPRFPTPSTGHVPQGTVPPFDASPEFATTPSEWTPDGSPRDWRYVVLHHTATDTGSVESIHEAHLRRKDSNGNPWKGIGYHFVIGNGNGMPDGAVEPTFRWRQQMHGAHAGSNEHNQHGVGVVLVGNFEEHSPSPAQLASLRRLVAFLKTTYGLSPADVIAHNDVKATACPGKLFPMDQVALAPLDDSHWLAGSALARSRPSVTHERRHR